MANLTGKTALVTVLSMKAAGAPDARYFAAEKQPTCRTSDPSEMGALALWLCDPVAHNVTGTQIPVDGGWTAQ